MSHADFMYAAKSISCGSVLRYSQRKRDSVSLVARGLISHKSQHECKQKQTETIPSLLHAPVQITS